MLDHFRAENLFRVLQIVVCKAERIQVPVSVCITDASGLSLAFLRMEGAKPISVELAPKKAYTAAMFKMATKDLGGIAQPEDAFFQMGMRLGGKIVTFGGGVPLLYDNNLIGAIGVSGGSADQDHEIAQAATDVFLKL
ncbi:heme-binding protein [Chitinophaga sp. OAE865]|uniref:GlcG/HbpS family heme-binding protein n=1 Tax=Chitinophaga sp. OAE865 TaxID=2817898 RepID=UPI001AEB5593